MKKILGIILTLAMVTSLGAPVLADEPDYTTGTPWLECDLEGNVTADTPSSLKDHFALYVNKDKILSLEIQAGMSEGGTQADLALQNVEDTKAMFSGEAPTEHDAKLAYDLFWLMMDWDSRNEAGVAPLKKVTDRIDAIDSIDALNAYFLETPVEDLHSLLYLVASTADMADSSRNILVTVNSSLLLDDSAEYSKLTDYGKMTKDADTVLLQKMLVKLGYSEEEAQQKIDNCFAYETAVSSTIATNEEQKSADYTSKKYNVYSRDELKDLQGKVPVLELFEHFGYPEADRYMVISPGFLTKLDELYTDENLSLFKDYLIVHTVDKNVSSLDKECYDWALERSEALSGSSSSLPDEDIFASKVSAKLKWPVARLYSETYLKQEDKDRISALVDEIIDAYHDVIGEAEFLSEDTRAKAIEKLDALKKNVLFPDDWSKYECGELNFASKDDGGSLWEALRSIDAYEIGEKVKEYSEPIDKDKWAATPNTVNCFNYQQSNTIYIMGAYCRGVLYSTDMSDEELYGKMGWVIGHEISHSFDSTGAQYDKDGNLASWWTEDDYNAFLALNEKLANYYNNMHPWEGQNFYGNIMTGEACADMGGMRVMLRIAADREDFDYDVFFRSLAEVWFSKHTLQKAYQIINDTHPMGYLRINATLQQFDEFLNFYGITEGDGMYLAPEDRVAIW